MTQHYEELARAAAIRAGIDPDIFHAQIRLESGFNPLAESYAGAQGIAQIIPRFHPNVDPWDPEASLNYAANLISGYLTNYGGDIRKALTAYHAGSGTLASAIRLGGADWEQFMLQGAQEHFGDSTAQRVARDNANYLRTILGGGVFHLKTPRLRVSRPGRPDVVLSQEESRTFRVERDFTKRLQEIYTNVFGRPAGEVPEEPFPGFNNLIKPFVTEYENTLLGMDFIQAEIARLTEDASPLSVRGAAGPAILGPTSSLLPFFTGLIGATQNQLGIGEVDQRTQAINEQLAIRQEANNALLTKYGDLIWLFQVVMSQIITFQEIDPEVRADIQATEIDARLERATPQQLDMIQPLINTVRSYYDDAVNQLSLMTEDEIVALTSVDLEEKLFTIPRARPIASYLLSTEELRLSLKGFTPSGPSEEATGEEIRRLLQLQGLDDEEILEYQQDVKGAVSDLLISADEITANIEALKAGAGDWILPRPGIAQYLKASAIQPLLVATVALEKYQNFVVRPIAGSALLAAAFITPGEQQIERDFQEALKDNNVWIALQKAERENDLNPVAKFALETLADPTTYIGWGIATKLVRPLPIIGSRLGLIVGAAERGYIKAANAPFTAIFKGLKAIPKPASTIANLSRIESIGVVRNYLARFYPNTRSSRITAAETTAALGRAIEKEVKFPYNIQDVGVQVGKILKSLPTPSVDDVALMSQRAGGNLTKESVVSSKTLMLSVEQQLTKAVNDPRERSLVARSLLTLLQVEDNDVGIKAVKLIVSQRIADADRQAQRLITGSRTINIIEGISQHTFEVTLANSSSATALRALQLGKLSYPMIRIPAGVGALWSGSIERFVIVPLARAYLLFPMYHPWNVIETMGKIIFANKNPIAKGTASQRAADTWSDVTTGPITDILMGRGRGLVLGEKIGDLGQAKTAIGKAYESVRRAFGESLAVKYQANAQAQFIDQVALDNLQVLRPNEWKAINNILKTVGTDFSFLPPELRGQARDLVISSIVRGPNAIRALSDDLTIDRLRTFKVHELVSKYDHIDSPIQDFIVEAAETGRLWSATNDVIGDVDEAIWHKYLTSPEHFALNFEAMVDEVVTAPITTNEEFMRRLVTLQGMSRAFGDVGNFQYKIAREASEKVVKAADNDAIWGLYRKQIDKFGEQAGKAFNRYVTALRRHTEVTGNNALDIETLISKYEALNALEAAAYIRQREIARQLFEVEAKAGSKLRSSNEWWLQAKARLGEPFREMQTARSQMLRDVFALEAKVGSLAKNPVPNTIRDVEGGIANLAPNRITRLDVASLYGIQPDDVMAMTYLPDMQAIMGKQSFVDDVLNRVAYNLEPGQEASSLGWTAQRIGEVWDDIMREMRLDPRNVSAIAPTMLQFEDMTSEIRLAKMTTELPNSAKAGFARWTDDLASRLEGVEGYWDKADISKGRLLTVPGHAESIVEVGASTEATVLVGRIRVELTGIIDTLEINIVRELGDPDLRTLNVLRDFMQEVVALNPDKRAVAMITNKKLGNILVKLGAVPVKGREDVLDVTKVFTADFPIGLGEGGLAPSWLAGKKQALGEASDEFFQTFPDYINLTYLDVIMRSQMPYWTYEFHRLFYLPRQFMRTPGLITGLGRYNEFSEGDNYFHVPFTSLEINPLRGTILMGGLRRLTLRDYPEFYDTFPAAQQSLDVMGRFGFYPGAHVTAANILFGASSPQWDQIGEAVPVFAKAPIQGFRAFAEATGNETLIAASERLANVFIPERFRDYLIGLQVSDIGAVDPETGAPISGADLINKRLAGTPLTEFEEDLWTQATGDMSPEFLLMDQTGLFRFRPEERQKALDAYNEIVSEYTGISRDQLDYLIKWGYRWQDIVPPNSEMRDLLNTTEFLQKWAGFTSVLFGASEQNFRARRNEFWDEVNDLQLDIRVQQETIDCQFGFPGAAGCDNPDSITSDNWIKLHSDLGGNYRGSFDSLREQDRYKDIPVTRDEVLAFYQKTGQALPIEHPEVELLRMFYDIQVVDKFNPETGKIEKDWFTFFAKREMLLQAAGDFRSELESIIDRNETPLEKLWNWSYQQFLRPYYNRAILTISRFSKEQQVIIQQWIASDNPLDRDVLEEIEVDGRSLIGQYQEDLKTSGRQFRFWSPNTDSWLAFWGITDSFRTIQGQDRYKTLLSQYRPSYTSVPELEVPSE